MKARATPGGGYNWEAYEFAVRHRQYALHESCKAERLYRAGFQKLSEVYRESARRHLECARKLDPKGRKERNMGALKQSFNASRKVLRDSKE